MQDIYLRKYIGVKQVRDGGPSNQQVTLDTLHHTRLHHMHHAPHTMHHAPHTMHHAPHSMHQLRADMAAEGKNYELHLDWANRAHGVRTRCRAPA